MKFQNTVSKSVPLEPCESVQGVYMQDIPYSQMPEWYGMLRRHADSVRNPAESEDLDSEETEELVENFYRLNIETCHWLFTHVFRGKDGTVFEDMQTIEDISHPETGLGANMVKGLIRDAVRFLAGPGGMESSRISEPADGSS